MINVIKTFNVVNIDFLACDTLLYSNYTDYYQLLTKNTNVIVGASDNKVGNPKNGGDWIMENINEDIKGIYFTDKIEDYNYLLDNNGKFNIVLLDDGKIYGSGDNSEGQLGNGTTDSSTTLTEMTSIPFDILSGEKKKPYSISALCNFSSQHDCTIILMDDGTIYSCGYNGDGQLGNGTTNDSYTLQAGLTSLGNPITGVKSLANDNPILTISTTTTTEIINDNTNFCKGCQICTDNSTTDHVVEYKPLKTIRRSDNMSQKMKQAAFIRRTQNTSITQIDAINFRFKNL